MHAQSHAGRLVAGLVADAMKGLQTGTLKVDSYVWAVEKLIYYDDSFMSDVRCNYDTI